IALLVRRAVISPIIDTGWSTGVAGARNRYSQGAQVFLHRVIGSSKLDRWLRLTIVVEDGADALFLVERSIRRIRQLDHEGFVRFVRVVAVNQNFDRFVDLTGGES